MYREEPYTGIGLPSKTLCLTYDDGPGQHTYEIARFLYEQKIPATFFVVGKYAFHHQDILKKVSRLGHLIGNHTYDHPDMPYYLSINGDLPGQVLRTDAIIKKYVHNNTVYLRSPYGKWSPEVANELNANILSANNHIGPVHWDIAGEDCYYWQNGYTVEEAVDKYLQAIREKDHGIVVMHDEIADMNYLKESNNTFELTKRLIPRLKLLGFRFVGLDEIESIKKDASKPFKFTLRTTNGKFLNLPGRENNVVNAGEKHNKTGNQLSMVDLGHGKIALKAANGLFFSLQPGNENVITASGREINENETFDLIPLASNQLALRAYNGNFLVVENKNAGKISATAAYIRGAERFSFSPVGITIKKNISLGERFRILKRQVLYVKSKIQQG